VFQIDHGGTGHHQYVHNSALTRAWTLLFFEQGHSFIIVTHLKKPVNVPPVEGSSLEIFEDYLGLEALNPLNNKLLGSKALRPR